MMARLFLSLLISMALNSITLGDKREGSRVYVEENKDHQPIPLVYQDYYRKPFLPRWKQCYSRGIKNFETRCSSARYWFSLVRLRHVCDNKKGEYTERCLPLLPAANFPGWYPYKQWTVYTAPLSSYDPDTFEEEAVKWTADSKKEIQEQIFPDKRAPNSSVSYRFGLWPMRLTDPTRANGTHAVYVSERASNGSEDDWRCGVIVFGFPDQKFFDMDIHRKKTELPARYMLELALPISWEDPCYNVPACWNDDGVIVREVCVNDPWEDICQHQDPAATPADGVSKICLTFMYTVPLVHARRKNKCQGNLLAEPDSGCSRSTPCSREQTCNPKIGTPTDEANVQKTAEAVGKAMSARLKDPIYEPHSRFHHTSQKVTADKAMRKYKADTDKMKQCSSVLYYYTVLGTHLWCEPSEIYSDAGFQGMKCPVSCQRSICKDTESGDEKCDIVALAAFPEHTASTTAFRMEDNKSPAGFKDVYFYDPPLKNDSTLTFLRILDKSRKFCGQLSFAFADYDSNDVRDHGFGGNRPTYVTPIGSRGNDSDGLRWQTFNLLGSITEREPNRDGAVSGVKEFTYKVGDNANCKDSGGVPQTAYISFAVAYFVVEFEAMPGIRVCPIFKGVNCNIGKPEFFPDEVQAGVQEFQKKYNLSITDPEQELIVQTAALSWPNG